MRQFSKSRKFFAEYSSTANGFDSGSAEWNQVLYYICCMVTSGNARKTQTHASKTEGGGSRRNSPPILVSAIGGTDRIGPTCYSTTPAAAAGRAELRQQQQESQESDQMQVNR